MQQFIDMATSQLGISQEAGTSATKGILGMIAENMGGEDFAKLRSALPGAETLVGPDGGEPAPSAPAGGGLGGLLGGALGGGGGGLGGGGLGGMLGGALGAAGGGGLGAMMQLATSGLDPEQLGGFAKLFLEYVKSEAGQEMLGKVLASVPQLSALLKG